MPVPEHRCAYLMANVNWALTETIPCAFPIFYLHFFFCRLQHELEVSTKQAIFVGSSISDTIRTCIVLGNHRAAMRVRAEFKVLTIFSLEQVSNIVIASFMISVMKLIFLQVSEKRWYWLKAFALATVRDWDALEKFSKEKRPPGGKFPSSLVCQTFFMNLHISVVVQIKLQIKDFLSEQTVILSWRYINKITSSLTSIFHLHIFYVIILFI